MGADSLDRALFEFIAAVIVLSFAFRVSIMLAGPPLKIILAVLLIPLSGGRYDRASYLAALLNPLLLALLYGAFIALITVKYAALAAGEEQDFYLAAGALAAVCSLLSYSAGLRAKVGASVFGDDSEDRPHRIAATASFFVGTAAFGVSCYLPGYVMALPGAELFFRKVFELAGFLNGYKLVQIILVLAVSGYFLVTGVGKLFGGLLTVVRWLKRRLWGMAGL